MSAMLKTFKFVVEANKYRTIVNDAFNFGALCPTMELVEEEQLTYKQNILKLADLCRVNLCADLTALELVADKYEVAVIDNECEMALKVVKIGMNELTTKGIADFTDMIYVPNVKNLTMTQFDFVFIDECQDLSACQRELFLKALKPNGRFVAVGDPRQAIYGFAGADVESFNVLKSLPNTIHLPLSVCYRSDSAIIDIAKEIVPQIEARENAPMGEVKEDCKLSEILDGDMILCRVNAPLVALCMKYIADGVKAYVKGKDIGANLINMIQKTKCRNIADAIAKIEKEGQKIVAKIVRKQKCSEAEAKQESIFLSFEDKLRAIEVLSTNIITSDAVCRRIESIFKDTDRSGICLSSVHKAKGLESNNVYILLKEKFYNKYAMKIPWMAEQETNLVYVAYTRAKHKLGFIADSEFRLD
jgi:DNA helicase IV